MVPFDKMNMAHLDYGECGTHQPHGAVLDGHGGSK
jgi:hypothetical protein